MNNSITQEEKRLFEAGTWTHSFDKMGAHPCEKKGVKGYTFTVWAPGAKKVNVVGDFNDWNEKKHAMRVDKTGAIWKTFIPGISGGELYKYLIETESGEKLYKADPYAFYAELRPGTASVVMDIDNYKWNDARWMSKRMKSGHMNKPFNIYEVHLGSWRCHDDGSFYTYDEMADELVAYAVEMGYTHLEIMPVMEHPFDGSWGYQITGYYAPTSRYGTPQQFMNFVEKAHKAGIGVILDWVPGHFCRDEHGLGNFTGQKVYESEDHAQWGTYTFDFSRGEIRSFLLSNAFFWIEKYHVDGIRVDGVSSILYMNFGIDDPGCKRYNPDGTEGDLQAIDFLQKMNEIIGKNFTDVLMIAEESTAWPLVTRPPEVGGLGFHYKWDMGWMNDTLNYIKTDFPYKPGNHTMITFSMMYAYNENFILPLSHDEVVHGKCSVIGRMPGDYWRKFAGSRVLAMYQMCHPGGKLNFMGNEIAQFIEWRFYEQLEWFLVEEFDTHRKHQQYIKELNAFYKDNKALWVKDTSWDGFEWLDADNSEQSIICFVRHGDAAVDDLIVVLNFTPQTYTDYRIGVTRKGLYSEVFNSDNCEYGGSGVTNQGDIESEKVPWQGQDNSVVINVPPIGGVILKRHNRRSAGKKPAEDKKVIEDKKAVEEKKAAEDTKAATDKKAVTNKKTAANKKTRKKNNIK